MPSSVEVLADEVLEEDAACGAVGYPRERVPDLRNRPLAAQIRFAVPCLEGVRPVNVDLNSQAADLFVALVTIGPWKSRVDQVRT